ncbi:MAG: ankyrin repeat domain-containing protein [Colwellia sp.]
MKNWQDYKKTYRTESDIFDFARCGDLSGLASTLSDSPELDLDAKNHRGYSALMLAVYNGNRDFCEALLRCRANVDSADFVGNTPLMGAAFKGDLKILKLLLRFDANATLKNKSNMTVRDWAAMFKRAEIIEYFDKNYGSTASTSKVKNFFRFIKLGAILLQMKITGNTRNLG